MAEHDVPNRLLVPHRSRPLTVTTIRARKLPLCNAVLQLGNSTHKYNLGGGGIHCLLFYGKRMTDVIADINAVGKFCSSKLSPLGQYNYDYRFEDDRSRMVACHQCISRCTRLMIIPEDEPQEQIIPDGRGSFLKAEEATNPEINVLHYLIALSTCISPEERQESRQVEYLQKNG